MKRKGISIPRLGIVENYRHCWLLLLWFLYFAMFILVEHVVTDNYYVSYLPLDNFIPFIPSFVIFYVLWYPMLFFMTIHLMFWDVAAFKRYMLFIGIGFNLVSVFYLFFPNGQDLRPAVFETQNAFTCLIGQLYRADTNTNVCPSLHVIGCAAFLFALYDTPRLNRKWFRVAAWILSIFVIASTVFIKQHSVLDVFIAIPYASLLYLFIYRVLLPKRRTV